MRRLRKPRELRRFCVPSDSLSAGSDFGFGHFVFGVAGSWNFLSHLRGRRKGDKRFEGIHLKRRQ